MALKVDNALVRARLGEVARSELLIRRMPVERTGRKIFITGGAGNVATNIALALKQRTDCRVVAFDNLHTGHREAAEIVGIRLIEGSLTNPDEIQAALKEDRKSVV